MEQLMEFDGSRIPAPRLFVTVFSGFLLAFIAPGLHRIAGRASGLVLALFPLALVIYFATFLPVIASGETFHVRQDWVPTLGVNLSFALDGLSLLFVLLICGIGALVLVYAGGYLDRHPDLGRFYAFLLTFMASMLGLVLASNLLAMFVFWELTSLSSYFLIGFDHERPKARWAALQALLITSGGGLALMAGVILLGLAGGSLEISTLLTQADGLRLHPLYAPALLLILLGAFTKSAQFPFHFWLPAAMEAPTPVSAYLHSATMVKAGVYLVARLSPVLGGTDLWTATLSIVGGTTMLLGAWLALVQSDLKRILAYSTISSLGMLMLLLGLGGELGVQAAVAFLLGHALYKGALFLIAGALDHATGTRDVDRLSGLGRVMPITAVAAGAAALSMAGLPPSFGFLAKELTYEATLHAPVAVWGTIAVVAANILLVAVAGVVGLRPFLGQRLTALADAHEVPPSMWLGPIALAVFGVAMGIWPALGVNQIVAAASTSVLNQSVVTHLALWHGMTPALALSVVTVAAGVGTYAGSAVIRHTASRWGRYFRWGPAAWYEWALTGLNRLAVGQTQLLQSGYLRHYLIITVATISGLAGYSLLGRGPLTMTSDWSDLQFYEAALVALILLAVLTAVLARSRLAAITALGVVGYGVAMLFVLFGAPDLAMTQFLVETLTVILFVLVFYHLPEPRLLSGRVAKWRDAVLALAAGGVMTAFAILGTPEYYPAISDYYAEHSVTYGHGRNIVNVLLVDFRGLDTLGEITVLSVAAIGVFALLKLRRNVDINETNRNGKHSLPVNSTSSEGARQGKVGSEPSLILRTTTSFLLPLLLLFSLFLLVRGHNEPGGGFSGGLVGAAAFVLYRFAFGIQQTRQVLPVDPRTLIGMGLLVALSSGCLALLAGQPLMTGLWGQVPVPGFGNLDVGTPLLFDVGVYLAVVGVTLSIILPLAEE